jgi:demethylmenaquinone methyltransferase/2-methoxy-6-polyprenyl-1,4-benzoquinol methylase
MEQNRQLLTQCDALPANAQVLDLGSGTGIGTRAIAETLGSRGEVTGLDFSPEMVAIANRKSLPSNLRFVQGDACAMPEFESDSIDLVVANSFLYLVSSPEKMLKEVRRVLKPKGQLVFMEPRERGSLLQAARHALGQVSMQTMESLPSSLRMLSAMLAWRTMSGLEGRPSEETLLGLFQEAGFTNIRFVPTLGGLGHYVIAS